MTELLAVTPRDMGAEPYRIEEIDAHPDSKRIWASILAVREALEEAANLAEERGYEKGYEAGLEDG